jgi:isochorismate synthase EntC
MRHSKNVSTGVQAAIEKGLEKIRKRIEWSRAQLPKVDASRLKRLDDIVHLYTCLPTADYKVCIEVEALLRYVGAA